MMVSVYQERASTQTILHTAGCSSRARQKDDAPQVLRREYHAADAWQTCQRHTQRQIPHPNISTSTPAPWRQAIMCPRCNIIVRHRLEKMLPTLPRCPRRQTRVEIIFQDEYCRLVLEDCQLQRGDMLPSATIQRIPPTMCRIYCFYPCASLLLSSRAGEKVC